MANRLKGEVAVELGDGEGRKTLIFRLGINELIGLQEALGLKDDDERFLTSLDNLRSLRKMRAAVKAALVHGQPEITDEQAGDVITNLGFRRVGEIIAEALMWALPDKSQASQGAKGKAGAASPGPPPS